MHAVESNSEYVCKSDNYFSLGFGTIGHASKFLSFFDNGVICNRSLECMWTHGSTSSDVIRSPRHDFSVPLRSLVVPARLHSLPAMDGDVSPDHDVRGILDKYPLHMPHSVIDGPSKYLACNFDKSVQTWPRHDHVFRLRSLDEVVRLHVEKPKVWKMWENESWSACLWAGELCLRGGHVELLSLSRGRFVHLVVHLRRTTMWTDTVLERVLAQPTLAVQHSTHAKATAMTM